VATCLALDEANQKNEIFVASENQKILLNWNQIFVQFIGGRYSLNVCILSHLY
jgi:hypothetical protein